MAQAIQAEGLTYRYGPLTAVDHISFSVAEGEILGFLGPNGAGKSTTVKMLTAQLRQQEGRRDGVGAGCGPASPSRYEHRLASVSRLPTSRTAHWL